MLGWWLVLILGFGLIGNGYMAIMFFRAGHTMGGLLFTVFFGGACVYAYRTYLYWDEVRPGP
jgi:hypothetical protein